MTTKKGKIHPLSHIQVRPALFCDLDGTIRESKRGRQFIDGPKDVKIIKGVSEALLSWNTTGYMVMGVTNQGGIAHGYKNQGQVFRENIETNKLLENVFTTIRMCPSEEDGTVFPYCFKSMFRKPNIGMLAMLEAEAYQRGIIIDFTQSYFTGDRPEDEECAKNAGIKFIHAKDLVKFKVPLWTRIPNPYKSNIISQKS